MRTVVLEDRPGSKEIAYWIATNADFLKGERNAALIGLGNVGRWFLEEVYERGYPYKFTLIMDSNHVMCCEEGIESDEVDKIYKAKMAGKGLNNVRIQNKKVDIFDVKEDEEKKEILKSPGMRFSQLVLTTPSSDRLTKLNRDFVNIAIDIHNADLLLAAKNTLTETKNFNNTMRKLYEKKRYASFNTACGVGALIPTILSYYSAISGNFAFEGILNASTNKYIQLLEEGYTSDKAINKLVKLGSLEPGGSITGEGKDIFTKTRIIQNVIQYMSPEGVAVKNTPQLKLFEDEIKERVNIAKKKDKRVKIVSAIKTQREKKRPLYIESNIDFKELDKKDPLRKINGLDCGFVCYVGNNRPIFHSGQGAGKVTGKILYEDSLRIYRKKFSGTYTGPFL